MLFKLLNRAINFDFFYNIITPFHNFYMKCNIIFYSRYCPCLIPDSLDRMSLMVTTLQRQTTKRSDASPFFCSQFLFLFMFASIFYKNITKIPKICLFVVQSQRRKLYITRRRRESGSLQASTNIHQLQTYKTTVRNRHF